MSTTGPGRARLGTPTPQPRIAARRITRRAVLGAFAITLASGAAVACGAPGGAGRASDQSAGGPITWWDYSEPGPSADAWQALLGEYQAAHPGTTIDRRFVAYADLKKTLLQSASAGALPDVVIINSPDHQQFAELGVAADLTSRAQEWGQLDRYPTGLIDSARWEGKLYGLPAGANCLALLYDADLFEAQGLTPPTTWDELRTTAQRLTSSNRYGLAYAAPANQQAVFQWLPALWQAGGDLTDLTTPAAQKALQFWVDLMNDGSVSREALAWDQSQVGTEFAQRRAAMMINGPWITPAVKKEAPDLNWRVALLPGDVQQASVTGGENYLVVEGPRADAAWQLVAWLQDPERVGRLCAATGNLPTRTDVPSPSDPATQVFIDQLKVARPRAYGPNYPQISDAATTALQSAFTGTPPAQALSTAAQAIQSLLPQR
jgi:multiple sugar transport system substrate-binding protein